MYNITNLALRVLKKFNEKWRQKKKSLPLVSYKSENYAYRMPPVSQIGYLIHVSHEYLYFEAKWLI